MAKKIEHIAPVILAGGKSSRMGRNKAFVTMGDEKLIEIVVNTVAALFSRKPLLVTNSQAEYEYLGLPMAADLIPGMGPLGGIQAALRLAVLPQIFVFGCDMPFIGGELTRYMSELAPEFDVVMPLCRQAMPEPLHAVYSRTCLPAVEACLKRGERRVTAFLPEVRVRYLDEAEMQRLAPHGAAFVNINTPDELEAVRKIWIKAPG